MEDEWPHDNETPKNSPQASETSIWKDIRKFYAFEDQDCECSLPELNLLAEEYAVNVSHPEIGDDVHKPTSYFCKPEDKEFAAKIREISDWEDLRAVIGERLGLFRSYVKSNSDHVLMERLNDVIKFCIRKYYDDCKLYCAFMITYRTHEFFVSALRRTPMETYAFFRELILCHADEEPPFSYEVFSPEEASELLLDFCKSYLRNLPLIRHICLPSFALRIKTMAGFKDNNVEDVSNAADAAKFDGQPHPEMLNE